MNLKSELIHVTLISIGQCVYCAAVFDHMLYFVLVVAYQLSIYMILKKILKSWVLPFCAFHCPINVSYRGVSWYQADMINFSYQINGVLLERHPWGCDLYGLHIKATSNKEQQCELQ